MPGKPFRIRKQTGDGETLPPRATNACRCCYRPLPARVAYCSQACEHAHQRLTKPRTPFICTIDETAP